MMIDIFRESLDGDSEKYPRFLQYDKASGTVYKLEVAEEDKPIKNENKWFTSVIRFFTALFNFLTKLFRGEISFGSKDA
jgi:hypothetical protein